VNLYLICEVLGDQQGQIVFTIYLSFYQKMIVYGAKLTAFEAKSSAIGYTKTAMAVNIAKI
jgi:hypothetical protein